MWERNWLKLILNEENVSIENYGGIILPLLSVCN